MFKCFVAVTCSLVYLQTSSCKLHASYKQAARYFLRESMWHASYMQVSCIGSYQPAFNAHERINELVCKLVRDCTLACMHASMRLNEVRALACVHCKCDASVCDLIATLASDVPASSLYVPVLRHVDTIAPYYGGRPMCFDVSVLLLSRHRWRAHGDHHSNQSEVEPQPYLQPLAQPQKLAWPLYFELLHYYRSVRAWKYSTVGRCALLAKTPLVGHTALGNTLEFYSYVGRCA